MKILQLRFKNLNSLAGEWAIDFTAPEYVSDGIFAISGPTGAGKSTIMDAICLALYGKTPRLKGISKSSNEIMSRHTGECFAEVVFESQKGQFRCTWSQHRAKKKATGELQNPNHEIVDFREGTIIESQIRTVAKAIEERTGMDFDRFTQSMLLAQGGFAAFLQADADERAPILEQITGTEIYSNISKNVHERRKAENIQLDLLKAETKGIVLLNDEEESIINQQLADSMILEAELSAKKLGLDHAILWLQGIEQIKSELVSIDIDTLTQLEVLKNFEPHRFILKRALQAAEKDGEYAALRAKRGLQSDELEKLKNAEVKEPEMETNLLLAESNHRNAFDSLNIVRLDAVKKRELIRVARDLDVKISERRKLLENSLKDHKKQLVCKIEMIKDKKNLQRQSRDDNKKLVLVTEFLNQNAVDASLVSDLTGIRVKIDNLKDAKANYTSIGSQLDAIQKQLEAADKQHIIQFEFYQNKKSDLTDALNKVSKLRLDLSDLLAGRLLRDYRSDYEMLMKDLAYLRKISDLETERKQLQDHLPCPLCGSLHHPFALDNIPEPDETTRKIEQLSALIRQADHFEAAIKKSESTEMRIAEELVVADKQLQNVQHSKETILIGVTSKSVELRGATEMYASLTAKIAVLLLPFGFADIESADLDACCGSLQARLKKWQDYKKQQQEISDEASILLSRIETANALIKSMTVSLRSEITDIQDIRLEMVSLTEKRTDLLGDMNPETEEQRLKQTLDTVELLERTTGDYKNKLHQELSSLKERILELQSTTKRRKEELDQEQAKFLISIRIAGFEDEEIFSGSILPIERRDELIRQADFLDKKQADLMTRKKDREERLLMESAKNLTEAPIADLLIEQSETKKSLNTIREEIGANRQKLVENANAQLKLGVLFQRRDKQAAECKRWESLWNLIGSSDGKRYRNFAQGLTFEIMVSHANLQLEKLTDRYLLVRDTNQPLDLNVIDNYQAGEIRTTKNLSGGESFIVSLALALGLSKMASKKVRVDSLFLDEGFGSLDEDTLETALETLANLRQDGKLIGVISHVPALKERITTRILVQKSSGGKSTISGPGCSKLD